MTKLRTTKQTLSPGPVRIQWERMIAGPDTIRKVMEGKVAKPTLGLLVSSPSAVKELNSTNPSSSKKIIKIASAWNTFLESVSREDMEAARPPFTRFVDAVADSVNAAGSIKDAQEMLGTLSLPYLLMYDSVYLLDTLFGIFAKHSAEEKGISALSYLENHCSLLYGPPGKSPYHIFSGMMEFYEQNPKYLNTLASRGCARSLSNLLFAHSKYLLQSNRPDLLAYGIAWGGIDLKSKLSLMENLADNYPDAMQTMIFSKVMCLTPMMPIYKAPTSKEFYSARFKELFPELRRTILYDTLLSVTEESSQQMRVYVEARRLLNLTGRHFVAANSEAVALHRASVLH